MGGFFHFPVNRKINTHVLLQDTITAEVFLEAQPALC